MTVIAKEMDQMMQDCLAPPPQPPPTATLASMTTSTLPPTLRDETQETKRQLSTAVIRTQPPHLRYCWWTRRSVDAVDVQNHSDAEAVCCLHVRHVHYRCSRKTMKLSWYDGKILSGCYLYPDLLLDTTARKKPNIRGHLRGRANP